MKMLLVASGALLSILSIQGARAETPADKLLSASQLAILDVAYKYSGMAPAETRNFYIKEFGKQENSSATGAKRDTITVLSSYILEKSREVASDRDSVDKKASRVNDADYRRLATAHVANYYISRDHRDLQQASQVIAHLDSKASDFAEIAFWRHYIGALLALESSGTPGERERKFESSIMGLWLDVVLKLEDQYIVDGDSGTRTTTASTDSGQCQQSSDFLYALPHIYKNLYELILNRGVLGTRLNMPGTLGIIISALADRNFCDTTGRYHDNLVKLVKRMHELDPINLDVAFTYTQLHTLDAGEKSATILDTGDLLTDDDVAVNNYYDLHALAFGRARNPVSRGISQADHMRVVAKHVDRMSRMNQPHTESASGQIRVVPGQEGAGAITTVKRIMADLPVAGQQPNAEATGPQHEIIADVRKRLWDELFEFVLATSDFYNEEPGTVQNTTKEMDRVTKAEFLQSAFLDLFRDEVRQGRLHFLPDSTVFEAALTASNLARIKFARAHSGNDSSPYNDFVSTALYSISLYPLDLEFMSWLIEQLRRDARMDIYRNRLLPIQLNASKLLSKANMPSPNSNDAVDSNIVKYIQYMNSWIPNSKARVECNATFQTADTSISGLPEIKALHAAVNRHDLPPKSRKASKSHTNSLSTSRSKDIIALRERISIAEQGKDELGIDTTGLRLPDTVLAAVASANAAIKQAATKPDHCKYAAYSERLLAELRADKNQPLHALLKSAVVSSTYTQSLLSDAHGKSSTGGDNRE